MRARTVIVGGIAVGLLAWLFGRRKTPPAAPPASRTPPRVPTSIPAPAMTYAELRRMDDAAVAAFSQANAEGIVARNSGDAAGTAAAAARYKVAWERHLELDRLAREAWNRENGVR